MKIKFDEQQYQLDAIKSITDIFEGQPVKVSNFTVSMGNIVGQELTELGIGNKLELSDAELLENVQKIQVRNHLKKVPIFKIETLRLKWKQVPEKHMYIRERYLS